MRFLFPTLPKKEDISPKNETASYSSDNYFFHGCRLWPWGFKV
jgi:hypothetical protein